MNQGNRHKFKKNLVGEILLNTQFFMNHQTVTKIIVNVRALMEIGDVLIRFSKFSIGDRKMDDFPSQFEKKRKSSAI